MENGKPYEKYKDSDIAWLEMIPEHWKIISFKNILKERNEKNDPVKSTERLSLSIDKGVTLYSEKTTNLDRFKDDLTQYKLAYKDDLVFNSMNMIVGAVGVSNYFGCVSPVYYTYYSELNHAHTTKFYEYLFRCKTVQRVLFSLGRGLIAIDRGEGKYNTLRLKVSRDDLRSLRLPFPNLSEQTAIARFLDFKLSKIDRFIRKKKQLIKLLNEQKAGIINHAVTKGIDPNAKMKPSGIEWLGKIPEHWEVKRLKYLINGRLKYGANEPGGDFKEDDPRYIRITDFEKSGKLRDDTFCTLNNVLAEPYLLKEGDILFARSGGTVGKTFQFRNYNGKACYAGYLIKAEPNSLLISSDYLFEYTNSGVYESWKSFIFNKATIENIGADKYAQMPVILPSIKEQNDIVEFINYEGNKIQATISTIEKEIALTQEYRTALIVEAVTGKIDVRDFEVPGMGEEEESFEEIEEELSLVEVEEYNTEEVE